MSERNGGRRASVDPAYEQRERDEQRRFVARVKQQLAERGLQVTPTAPPRDARERHPFAPHLGPGRTRQCVRCPFPPEDWRHQA